MKVITKCIIDIKSLLVIEEESYEYSGPLSMCGGSGGGGQSGGGGGGGGSGAVSYPQYMQDWHGEQLDALAVIMSAAQSASPFVSAVSYNPDAELASMLDAPEALQTMVDSLSNGTGLDELMTGILSNDRLDAAVEEFSIDLGNRSLIEAIPRFESGMRDINAVMSSAFVIGRALIENETSRQVNKYSAELHMRTFSDSALSVVGMKLQYQQIVSGLIIEANRMKIAAKKEQTDEDLKIDESDAIWDLETFKYAGNLLASIGGGTATTPTHQPEGSKLGGTLSGAMAGAQMGSSSGSGWGTVIGAIIGGAAGYYSS